MSSTEESVYSRQVNSFELRYHNILHLTTEAYSLIETHSEHEVEAENLFFEDLCLKDEEADSRLDAVLTLLEEEYKEYVSQKKHLNKAIDKGETPYVRERYEQIWREAEGFASSYSRPLLDQFG